MVLNKQLELAKKWIHPVGEKHMVAVVLGCIIHIPQNRDNRRPNNNHIAFISTHMKIGTHYHTNGSEFADSAFLNVADNFRQ